MEWLTKIEAALDAEIDRKLKRLVMLNEYDRLYGDHLPKLIEHRPFFGTNSRPRRVTAPEKQYAIIRNQRLKT